MRLESIELAPPKPGEVRVRHESIGVNYIDTYHRSGLYKLPMPSGIGVEAAGVVDELGAGVTTLAVGDRVGYCGGPIGAYAQAANVPAARLIKLPNGVSCDAAAAMLLKGLTVQYLFRQTYKLSRGETILFHAAAGGVGLIACQWARHLGVTMIGTVSSAEKAKLAKARGCDHIIDYTTEDVAARVAALTGGKKVPVVYDGVGKDTFIGVARQPRTARPAGVVRQRIRRRHRCRPRHSVRQGFAVRHATHARDLHGHAPRCCSRQPRNCSTWSRKAPSPRTSRATTSLVRRRKRIAHCRRGARSARFC